MQSAVAAAALALKGVTAEHTVGTRTVLDILDARQEALSARVQLVTAERDAYVAGFTVLAAMGRADARDLGLDTPDADHSCGNPRRVRDKVRDLAFAPQPVPVASSTALQPGQDATPVMAPGTR